jgi:hypothetical protein
VLLSGRVHLLFFVATPRCTGKSSLMAAGMVASSRSKILGRVLMGVPVIGTFGLGIWQVRGVVQLFSP